VACRALESTFRFVGAGFPVASALLSRCLVAASSASFSSARVASCRTGDGPSRRGGELLELCQALLGAAGHRMTTAGCLLVPFELVLHTEQGLSLGVIQTTALGDHG
jgi:hypothetical protein